MTFHSDPTLLLVTQTARKPGWISLVGAGPGAADLLTLRAINRMRAADIIFYDRLVEPEVLAMAGDRAHLVFVGKEVGAHSWPQERINTAIVAAALSGLNVVRLKSGDPSIFGRATEEIAAARAQGIAIDIIPGITAASAGAASLCHPLTERGQTERLVIVTATCRPGDQWQGLGDVARPGTTLALYMAMNRLPEIVGDLQAAGLAPDHAVLILAHISTSREAMVTATLRTLVSEAAINRIGNPAIIYIRIPKPQNADLGCVSASAAQMVAV
jgi:uroporphyrin-III C-methyltransferase